MENRIKELRKKLGLTQTDLAEKVGKTLLTVHRVESGKYGLSNKKAKVYADALGVRPEELFMRVNSARTVTVKSYVQAGHWVDNPQWDEPEWYEVAVPDDAELRPYTLYAAETRGPSMNKRYDEGTVLVFSDVIETGEDIQIGKRYILERERSDGMREATVKTLHQDEEGRNWLIPESTDPLHQQPIEVNGNEGDTIRILGRVRYSVSRE